MYKKLTLLAIAIFTFCVTSFSQDVIHKKGGEKIKCKITQVTPEEITYKMLDEVDGPTYTIDKAKVLKVVYQSGRVETYVSNASMNDPELYADQLKKAIKVNFLSPQFGYFQVSYEKSVKPGSSYEFDLSVLGAGRNVTVARIYETGVYKEVKRGAFGIALGAGYKFNKMPNYISRGSRYSHILHGSYAKPNAILGLYKENYPSELANSNVVVKRTVAYGSLGVTLGRQQVFGGKFLIDIGLNIGYMADNKKKNTSNYLINEDILSNNFTGTRIGSGAGFMMGLAIKVGLLIK